MQRYQYYASDPIAMVGALGGLKEQTQEHLSEMAADGWELVSTEAARMGSGGIDCVYFWKRLIG